jgi:hypothetical protein
MGIKKCLGRGEVRPRLRGGKVRLDGYQRRHLNNARIAKKSH